MPSDRRRLSAAEQRRLNQLIDSLALSTRGGFAALARRAGVSKSTMYNWRRDGTGFSMRVIAKALSKLGRDISEIQDGSSRSSQNFSGVEAAVRDLAQNGCAHFVRRQRLAFEIYGYLNSAGLPASLVLRPDAEDSTQIVIPLSENSVFDLRLKYAESSASFSATRRLPAREQRTISGVCDRTTLQELVSRLKQIRADEAREQLIGQDIDVVSQKFILNQNE